MVDDTAIGYIGVSIAVAFFGSYAVPVKLVKTGDGVFFQWVSKQSQIRARRFISNVLLFRFICGTYYLSH